MALCHMQSRHVDNAGQTPTKQPLQGHGLKC